MQSGEEEGLGGRMETTSKTPYSDATQVSAQAIILSLSSKEDPFGAIDQHILVTSVWPQIEIMPI